MINWKSFVLLEYNTRFHRFTTFWANANNRPSDNKSHLMLLSLTEQLDESINHRNELLITLAMSMSFGNKSTSDEKSMYKFEIVSKNQHSPSMNRTTNCSATWSEWQWHFFGEFPRMADSEWNDSCEKNQGWNQYHTVSTKWSIGN